MTFKKTIIGSLVLAASAFGSALPSTYPAKSINLLVERFLPAQV
jgi:hypothetical protein